MPPRVQNKTKYIIERVSQTIPRKDATTKRQQVMLLSNANPDTPTGKVQSSICVCRMSRQDDAEPLDTSTLRFISCRCFQASQKQRSAPSHTSVTGKRRWEQKPRHIDKADESLRLLRCPAIRMSVRYFSTFTIVQQAASWQTRLFWFCFCFFLLL